jgi:hypothetical protein
MIQFQLKISLIVDNISQEAQITEVLRGTATNVKSKVTSKGIEVTVAMTEAKAGYCVNTMSAVAYRLKSLHFIQQD